MEYLCLFWGSNNRMYTNCCIFSEAASHGSIIAPRPPCRSFCVQVADLCANDDHFVQRCSNLVCPQARTACVSDPTVSGVALDAKINCSLPYLINPYRSSGNRTYRHPFSTNIEIIVLIFLLYFLSRKLI